LNYVSKICQVENKMFFEIGHYFVFSFIAENWLKLLHAARCVYLRCMLLSCILRDQEQIRPVRLGGAISVIFGRRVWSRVYYCKRDEVYFTILQWQNNGLQDGLISRMLFCKLYKIMVKKVSFVGFRMGNRPPLDPPLCSMHASELNNMHSESSLICLAIENTQIDGKLNRKPA